MKKTFTLVLPCYNEAKSLGALADRVIQCAKKRNLSSQMFRLVLVENGSKDNSSQVMDELKRGDLGTYLEIVKITENRGYGYGVWQGLKSAKTDLVGWSHADEQCDPEDAFRAWEILDQESSKLLIKGKRHGRALKEWLFTRCFEFLTLIFLRRAFFEINAQPKVFQRALVSELQNPPFDFAFDLYVLVRAKECGYQVRLIDVLFPPRKHGQSNWAASFRSRFRMVMRVVKFMVAHRNG